MRQSFCIQKLQVKYGISNGKAGEVDIMCTEAEINCHQQDLMSANQRFISFFGGGKFNGEPELILFFQKENIESIRKVLEHAIIIFN